MGDILKSRAEYEKGWDPVKYIHRRRLRVGIARDPAGNTLCVKWSLLLGPTKADQTGARNDTRSFVLGTIVEDLSAAAMIASILDGDPTKGQRSRTTILKNHRTGEPITINEARSALERHLEQLGYRWLATTVHCLATVLANTRSGGELVAPTMGNWRSDTYKRYKWSAQGKLDMAGLEIGRGNTVGIVQGAKYELRGSMALMDFKGNIFKYCNRS